jgi:acyl-CoA synthetase (AMP-forming)/AMP-acid ligase II
VSIDAAAASPLTLGGLLSVQAATRGAQDLLICDDERLSYAEADARSRVLARSLLALGAGKSVHVGILMPTGAAFLTSLLAITRIGAVAIPISTFSTADELRWLLRNADVSVLLCARSFRSNDYVAKLCDALPGLDASTGVRLQRADVPLLRRIVVDDDDTDMPLAIMSYSSLLACAEQIDDALLDEVERDVTPSDRMVIVHTSGSTSAPKGVVHTHGALLRHVGNLNRLRRLDAGMRYFSSSPLFWIGGLAYNVLGVLSAGATLITSNATDAARTLDLLERERPVMVNGFAQTVAHLAKDPSFPSRDLRFIRSGNLWPILPDDIRPVDPELRHNMLGMTEMGSVCLMEPDENDQPEHRRGSFGRPVTDVETRIVDPETGATCATDEIGELWLRGPMLMQGYYRRERHEVFEPEGWFRSGDLFSVDAEGYFYFVGRRGDMIKTAGANVSPREVESALREVLADQTILVLGLPDAERGQVVVAVVIAPPTTTVDEAAIIESLRAKLSRYKVPRRVHHLTPDEVPMLSSGKIDTKRLPELLRGR